MGEVDSEEVPVAPIQDAMLDDATVGQLFFDVENASEGVEVFVKGGAVERATDRPFALSEARALFMSSVVHAVQLRYRYRGSEWWDTLIRQPQGVRLVRIEQKFR